LRKQGYFDGIGFEKAPSKMQTFASARVEASIDTFLAPRRSLLAPLPEHAVAADLLSAGADALAAGDIETARERLRQADLPVLFDYARKLMGPELPDIHRRRPVAAPPAKPPKAKARMPTAAETLALFARDGWRCRFCGCRVVSGRARSTIRACLPGSVPWGEGEGYHGAFFAMTASVDHVVPHSAGGGNEPENLVTACWSCQFGRGSYTIEELGLLDPRDRLPVVDGWDGLSRVIGKTGTAIARQGEATEAPQFSVMPDAPPPAAEEPVAAPRVYSPAQAPWLAALDGIHAPPSRRLIDLLESCSDLGVSWSLNKVLLARINAGNAVIEFMAVEPDGRVQVPWSIGGRKAAFRRFAEILAAGVPCAIAYETPKLWNVANAGGRRLGLLQLLDASHALRAALEALHEAMHAVDEPCSASPGMIQGDNMTNRDKVLDELGKSPGSARELSERCGLTNKQVRNAIDAVRAVNGYQAIRHNDDGTFSLP